MNFDCGDGNMALCHRFEGVGDLSHARIGIQPVAVGKSDLERVILRGFRRKIFYTERFAVAFNFVDQLRRNVMVMNIDGALTRVPPGETVVQPAKRPKETTAPLAASSRNHVG